MASTCSPPSPEASRSGSRAFVGFRGVERLAVDLAGARLVAAGFAVVVPVVLGVEAGGPCDGARFAVVVLFADAALAGALFAAALFEAALVDRRAFFVELPFGSARSIAFPALLAAPPTAFPALLAAPPTALPALTAAPPTALPAEVAALPTALPGPDAATLPAALPTLPAALPTVFPTFFKILPVSATFVLLIRPIVQRSTVVWACSRHARARSRGRREMRSESGHQLLLGSAPTMRSTGCPPRSTMMVGIENAWKRWAVLGLSSTLTLITLSLPR